MTILRMVKDASWTALFVDDDTVSRTDEVARPVSILEIFPFLYLLPLLVVNRIPIFLIRQSIVYIIVVYITPVKSNIQQSMARI